MTLRREFQSNGTPHAESMRFGAKTIFMLAPQRHGSNKTQSLLATRHPSLFGPFPPVLRQKFLPLEGPLGDGLLEAMVINANLSPRPVCSSGGDLSVTEVLRVMEDKDLPETVLGIMSAICLTGAARENRADARVLCKSPDNLLFIDEIIRDVEDAVFIHVIRDPRAVWNSGKGTPRGPQTPHASAMAWNDYHSKVHALSSRLPIHTLRFEGLLEDPELHLRKACLFLGIPFEPSMLNSHESSEARSAAMESAQLWGNLDKPVQPDRANAWERELSKREIEIVEHVCADMMTNFGYVCSLPPRELRDEGVGGNLNIELQAKAADPRSLQLEHLRQLYKEYDLVLGP